MQWPRISPFTWLVLLVVLLATIFPVHGQGADVLDKFTTVGIALLLFLHGGQIPRREAWAGAKHWRLHLLVFTTTFLLFPLLVVGGSFSGKWWLPGDLVAGFLFLGALPSAVSSSIAFTSIARGNVSAAVCNAAGSSLFGALLTPILMTLLLRGSLSGEISFLSSLRDISLMIILPFVAGQMSRRWTAGFFRVRKGLVERADQAVLLMIIYGAFAQSVAQGLWEVLSVAHIVSVICLCLLLLGIVIYLIRLLARGLGFDHADEIAAVFCGSKKSLALGLPMAQLMFGDYAGFGMIIFPIMCYNQIQIMVGAWLAGHYASSRVGGRLKG